MSSTGHRDVTWGTFEAWGDESGQLENGTSFPHPGPILSLSYPGYIGKMLDRLDNLENVQTDVNWNHPPICCWKWSLETIQDADLQSSNDLMLSGKFKSIIQTTHRTSQIPSLFWEPSMARTARTYSKPPLLQQHPRTSSDCLASEGRVSHLGVRVGVSHVAPEWEAASHFWGNLYSNTIHLPSGYLT